MIRYEFLEIKASLLDLVKQGIPSQLDPAAVEEAKKQLRAEALARKQARQANAEARQARADEKRRAAYAARAVRREAIIKNLTSKMTAVELGRWGKLVDTLRVHAVKRNTTSHDLRIDLGMVLPPEILTRVGLKADPINVSWTVTGTATKDWRARYAQQEAQEQPRIREEDLVPDYRFDKAQADLATAIVNSGKKCRGEPTIDRSEMINLGDRRIKPDRRR